MARNFDETNDSSDGAFIEVRFKDILSPEKKYMVFRF